MPNVKAEIKLSDLEKIDIRVGMPAADFIEDISCIVYYRDVFECGSTAVVNRHIDIEFSYGEYFEACEGTPMYEYICTLCDLSSSQKEQETVVIYQR